MTLAHVFFCDVFSWCISEGHNFHTKHRRTSNCHASWVSGESMLNLWNFQLSNDHTLKSIIRKSGERIYRQEMYNFKNRFLKYSQCRLYRQEMYNFKNRFLKYSQCRRQTLENRATNLIEGRQVGTFFSCFMTSSFLGFYLIRLRGLVDKVLDSVSPSRVPGNYCNTSRHALNIASPPGTQSKLIPNNLTFLSQQHFCQHFRVSDGVSDGKGDL